MTDTPPGNFRGKDVASTNWAYLVGRRDGSWAVSACAGAARTRVWEFESEEEAVLWAASKGLARGRAVSLGGAASVWELFEAVEREGAERAWESRGS